MTAGSGAGRFESISEPSEESLLRGARTGEPDAVARLYADHLTSSRRLATILAGAEAADELVSEAYARVLGQLRAGGGPTTNFRAYLHTAIRNLHRDTFRRTREVPASDRPWLLDDTESPIDDLIEGLDANGATAALASLPGTWQQVLWHLEVEGRKPAEVADLLATTPAVVSSLVYRAREGLRRAYLDQYAGPAPRDPHCRWTRARLSQYVRDDLSSRAATKVADHLAGCAACASSHAGMAQLNTQLAAYLFPVVLVGGIHALDTASEATAAVGASGAAGAPDQLVAELAARAEGVPVQEAASAAASGGSGGFDGLSRRVSATVAVAVVALVAVAATAFALTGDEDEPRSAPDDVITTGESDAGTPPAEPTPTTPPVSPEVTPPPSSAPTTAIASPVVVSPSAPVPSVPAPTDPPATQPTSPQPTSPPSTDPLPQPQPGLVKVRPVAPTATPITRCGTHGSLQLPRTPGVRYALVAGDGLAGPWVVAAAASPGYVIADGSPSRFSGDLGGFEPCPVPLAIREVTTKPTGQAASDPWGVSVHPTVPDQERRALTVTYWFDTRVEVVRADGAGWTCRGPGGAEVGGGAGVAAGARITCAFDGRATHPPAVTLLVRAFTASGAAVAPSGTAVLSADGDVVDIEDFESLDL